MVALRAAFALFVSIATAFFQAGHARAQPDTESSLVDGRGRTLTVQQSDTVLNGVYSLDRDRSTREWFQSARGHYRVVGSAAETFEGSLELGYQIGFPWSQDVVFNFRYTTPNVLIDQGDLAAPSFGLNSVSTPDLLPGMSVSADLHNGPGIQEVSILSVDVTGPSGGVAVSNAHGTVARAAGGVLLRLFVRLTSSTGDSVSTYSEPWSMN
ncbi:MAG: MspA family porin [Mycobacteriaceae bacterium]|nr:MspA family porin [Mycobacteriaceae bacterium]